MVKLSIGTKSKFILVIGDDGAILTYFEGKELKNRLFSLSSSLVDREEFHALLLKHPDTPISVIIDSIDQTYTKQILPAVSFLSIGKLVKRRLERDYTDADIKGAVLLGRSKAGRRDWIYMFASTPATEEIKSWLEYIEIISNPLDALYMLPVEMEAFVHKANQYLYKLDEGVHPAPWQFIVTHNKTGGFRQVILQDNRVVFTRLIRPGKDTLPDIVAGNVEQEILNTIDYLRRLSLVDGDIVDVIVIVSQDIKKGLESVKIRGRDVKVYTPSEMCEMYGYSGVCSDKDKFADLLIAASFNQCKPILPLYTDSMESANSLLKMSKMVKMMMIGIIPISLILVILNIYNIIGLSSSVQSMEEQKIKIESKWKNARKTGKYDIDDANKITDMITLHDQLSISNVSPLALVKTIYNAQADYGYVLSLNWRAEVKSSQSNRKKKKKKKESPQVQVTGVFNIRMLEIGNNIERLFKRFDQLTTSVKRNFFDFDVTHSKLPEKITFNQKRENIDVQFTVRSLSERQMKDKQDVLKKKEEKKE